MDTDNKKMGHDNYEKGLELELRFCAFMKSDLGYREAAIRRHMKTKVANNAIEVDIIGERINDAGRVLLILCGIYLTGFAILFCIGIYNSDDDMLLGGLIAEFAGITALLLSLKYNIENAWVECKNKGKDKVNLEQVRKSIDNNRDYKDTGDKEFKFNRHYFVSASGFVDDAYHYAKEKGVTCYIEKNGTFVEATYWNI